MSIGFVTKQIGQIETIRQYQQAQEAAAAPPPPQLPPLATPSRAVSGPQEGRGRIPIAHISRAGNSASGKSRRRTEIARDAGDHEFGPRRPAQHKVTEPIEQNGSGKQHMVPEKVRRRRMVQAELQETRRLKKQAERSERALAQDAGKASQAARRAVQQRLLLLTRLERALETELKQVRGR